METGTIRICFLAGHLTHFIPVTCRRTCHGTKRKGPEIYYRGYKKNTGNRKAGRSFLQPKSGTDGALAHAIANVLIERGWIDKPYIDEYVYGFEECYAQYVKGFNESNIEEITEFRMLALCRQLR